MTDAEKKKGGAGWFQRLLDGRWSHIAVPVFCVLLSLLVSFLLWQEISGSMTGLPFTLPWNYVALAAAMTIVAVGASVAYGMHRCRADNVVEALRADAV